MLQKKSKNLLKIIKPFSKAKVYYLLMYKDPNIQEELKTISSFWLTTNAIMPYQVPENYFEELLGVVRASIEKEAVYEELASIAPLLSSIPKNTVYQIPETQNKGVKAPIIVRKLNLAKLAVAAAMIGIAVLGNYLYTTQNEQVDYSAYINTDHSVIMQNISDSTLTAYLDVHEKLLTTPEISISTTDIGNSQSLIKQSSDEALLEYIKSSN
jgi:hypothetical protein